MDSENGQEARTEFRVLARTAAGNTLLEARPLTGRTNQIRVHLWHRGCPIVGDPVYLPGDQLGDTQTLDITAPPLCLHAWKIVFDHPLSGLEMEFTAPPPEWVPETNSLS